MEWRAMSRSRSRISMDWRPASRSRSRPPLHPALTFDQHGAMSSFNPRHAFSPLDHHHQRHQHPDQFAFPHMHDPSFLKLSTTTEPIPVMSRTLPTTHTLPPRSSDLLAVYESEEPSSFDPHPRLHHHHQQQIPSSSSYIPPPPTFAPSSLPLRMVNRPVSSNPPHTIDPCPFPRHVRKTSFDHTVSRDNLFVGLSGRHQVDGKPLSPNSVVGMKRPADAPHAESLLRADPPTVDCTHILTQEPEPFERAPSFPSSTFDFSFPPYDGFFDLPAPSTTTTTTVINPNDYHPTPTEDSPESHFHHHHPQHHPQHHHQQHPHHQHHSAPSSMPGPSYIGTIRSSSNINGLSPAAAAASVAMAEGYAQLAGTEDPALDYQQLMGLVYPTSNMTQNPYTHVDPTQILSVEQVDAGYQSFHASPSSDGWGNGITSAHTSPEAYNTSNASTPPSTESAPHSSGANNNRTFVSLKQSAQDLQRTKSVQALTSIADERSSTGTPESSEATAGVHGKGGSDDGESPTLCTNCQTTNTPLWRRDPEGHPLCEFFLSFFSRDILKLLLGFR